MKSVGREDAAPAQLAVGTRLVEQLAGGVSEPPRSSG